MKEFICACGTATESEVIEIAEKYFCSGCNVYAVHSDHFYCGTELCIDAKHLIELRIFTNTFEFTISRLNIGSDFNWRYINDDEFNNVLSNETDAFLRLFTNRTYDEEHYLDIDSTKSNGFNYTTTGGGKYTLPIENAEKVKIRNYLEYDENGIVIISELLNLFRKGAS